MKCSIPKSSSPSVSKPLTRKPTRKASVPLGDAGKEEEEREMETSELARGLPSCSGQDPKGGGLSLAIVCCRGWRLFGGGGGVNESPLEVLSISVWSPTSRGAAPPPTVSDEVTGNRDRSKAVGDEGSLLYHAEFVVGAVSSILRDFDLRRVGASPVEEALALLFQGTSSVRPSSFVDIFLYCFSSGS